MRLTNEIRRQIFANLVHDHRVAREARDIMEQTKELTMIVIASAYPKFIGNNLAFNGWLAQQRQKEESTAMAVTTYRTETAAFRTDEDGKVIRCTKGEFNVNFGGEVHTLSIRGEFCGIDAEFNARQKGNECLNVGHIVPGYADELACALVEYVDGRRLSFYLPYTTPAYEAGHALHEVKRNLDYRRRAVNDQYYQLKAQVMGVLSGFTSDAALVKAWPDVEQYLPAPAKPKTTAVALDVKTLNEICGIPR